jgi:DNA-binding transcriptional regulator YhcF (GntR family)
MENEIIFINPESPVSKYRQIVNSVLEAIDGGRLKNGDRIPSINQVCKKWNLSRDTVVNAYNELKSLGIISSAAGKGFYVESTNVTLTSKVFLLFDELNAFKEDLYNSFLENLDKNTQVDIFFHYFNRKLFNQIIEEAKGHYTTYVIMPTKFSDTLNQLSQISGRVIILDQLPDDLKEAFPAIYQNFASDCFNALMSGKSLIKKYNKLIMVHPGGKEPEGQYEGFMRFCTENNIEYELIHSLESRDIKPGEAYIVIWDRDLVWITKSAAEKGLVAGKRYRDHLLQ